MLRNHESGDESGDYVELGSFLQTSIYVSSWSSTRRWVVGSAHNLTVNKLALGATL